MESHRGEKSGPRTILGPARTGLPPWCAETNQPDLPPRCGDRGDRCGDRGDLLSVEIGEKQQA